MGSTNSNVGITFRAYNQTAQGLSGVRSSMRRLSRDVRTLAGTFGLYLGVRGVVGAFRSVTEAAMVQEQAVADLTAALATTGAATTANVSAAQAYASQMQQQTIYGDELILSQMAFGKNLGITTNRLTEATTAAIGLAAKYKLDLKSAMMLVGRASQGQTQMLTRYGIVLDETLSPQEKFDELLKIGAGSFDLATAAAGTHAGQLLQVKNQIGDVKEEIGLRLLPTYQQAMQGISTYLSENQDDIADWANNTVEMLGHVAEMAGTLAKTFNLVYKEATGGDSELNYWRTLEKEIDKAAEARYRFQMEQQGREPYSVPFAGPGLVTKTDTAFYDRIRMQVESEFMATRAREQAEADQVKELQSQIAKAKTPLGGQYASIQMTAGDSESMAKAITGDPALVKKNADDITKVTAQMYRDAGVQSEAATTAQLAELMKQRRAYEDMGIANTAIADWYTAKVTDLYEEQTDAATETSLDIAQAMTRMYDQIDSKSVESFETRRRLIQLERDEYLVAVKDKAAVEQWYRDQMERLDIDQAKATGGFGGGFTASVKEMNRELQTTGEVGYELGYTVRDGLVDGFADVAMNIREADDAMQSLAQSIARAGLTYAGNQIFTGLMSAGLSALGPGAASGGSAGGAYTVDGINTVTGGVGHDGGTVGAGHLPTRRVPLSLFTHAPHFLKGGEVPIIAHAGETIHTPGADAKMTVLLERILATLKNQGHQSQTLQITGMGTAIDQHVAHLQRTGKSYAAGGV